MIDLHCHLLPCIDDGAKDLETSLAMARMAVADGITITACTPHILPGVYNNHGPNIRSAVEHLSKALSEAGIPLQLIAGADVHIGPDLVQRLRNGTALTLHNTRYFLFEPPHHVIPPRLEDHIFGLQTAGFVPILTHPERLSWVDGHYDLVNRLVYSGVLMQITAGSLLGRFGRRPRYWAERMLADGICHLLATDAHNTEQRVPRLSEARDLVARKLGEAEATNMVLNRPRAIIEDANPGEFMPSRQPPSAQARPRPGSPSAWERILQRVQRVGRE